VVRLQDTNAVGRQCDSGDPVYAAVADFHLKAEPVVRNSRPEQ
jgi:hypothetical protein